MLWSRWNGWSQNKRIQQTCTKELHDWARLGGKCDPLEINKRLNLIIETNNIWKTNKLESILENNMHEIPWDFMKESSNEANDQT